MKKLKIFLFNGILLTVTSLIISTIGVGFNVYITNKVGSEAIGVYQLIQSVYLFAITLATSGIGLAATRIVAEELALGKEAGAKRAIRKCLLLSLLFGCIALLILWFSAEFISTNWLHGKVSAKPLYIIAISLPLISMAAAIQGYFTAVRRVVKSASSQMLEQFIKIIITVFALNLLMPNGLENACLALIIGSLLSEICSFTYLYILYLFDKKRYNSYELKKEKYTKRILDISMPVAITAYIRSGLSTFKQIITPIQLEKSGLNCEEALSKYGMVSGMVMPILLFPSAFIYSFASIITPEFARYYAKNDQNRIHQVINKIFKPTFIFSICIIGIFLTYAKPISLALYHNLEVAHYVKFLCPLIIIMYVDTVVDSILKGLDEQVAVMKYNIIDLIVSITCIYFLLPIMGINGYIVAIIASECTNTFLSTFKLMKVTHFKIKWKEWFLKPIFCMLLAFGACRLLSARFIASTATLVFQIVIFIITYLVFLYLVSCISKKDLKL